jgi:glycosyltransferase involved in cell wall biosynthesis
MGLRKRWGIWRGGRCGFWAGRKDLRPLYERARAFVVPTRYAAGLPFKAHEAAAAGVPLVVSSLIAAEGLWEELRANALQRIVEELSPEAFEKNVRSVLHEVAGNRAFREVCH